MTEQKEAVREEVSVEDLFLKLTKLVKYLFSKWILIVAAGIIGAGINLYLAYTAKPTYTANLTFVLSTGSQNVGGGLANLLGIDIGASRNDVFAGDNIITLFKSRRMIQNVLFKKPPDSAKILANIIITEMGWDKAWNKKKRTNGQVPFPDDPAKLTPIQDSLFRVVYSVVANKMINIFRNKNLAVYELSTTSTNEVFSTYVTRFLMDETAQFYIETKTGSARQALQLLQKETDSLRGILYGSISSAAAETDRTFALNPALQVQRAPAQKAQVKSTVLASAYAEMVRNLQLAKINLQRENPLFQIIDSPVLPLVVNEKSKVKAFIIGFALGAFLIISVLLLLLFIRYVRSI